MDQYSPDTRGSLRLRILAVLCASVIVSGFETRINPKRTGMPGANYISCSAVCSA